MTMCNLGTKEGEKSWERDGRLKSGPMTAPAEMENRVRPFQPCRAPGEAGCGLTGSVLPSSSSRGMSQPAGQPARPPHTPFGVSAHRALLGPGLGSDGYRAQMGG
ncbi:unnamed protein product [Pleuronectes platessa]|uniref:Uncharacterized protein n=1 Tax=Pleuronectes platessa TaxID=8262 RepID=A0A9N7YXB9_PLEPL|nr:unnamed protein product [Pleuronectes platessa]